MTCPTCSSPLDDDQRYCLNCGRRVGDTREDLLRALAPAPPPSLATSAVAVDEGPRLWSPLGGGALAVLLATGLALGALLFGGSDEPTVIRVAAAPTPDVNVNVAGGAGAGEAVPVELESDWPGDDGWTVQLETLPKEGTTPDQVESAKAGAASRGAADVGALDSDEWPSLDAGDYVIYAGVFTAKKQAAAALKKLRKEFPDAKVVRVSAGGTPKVDKDADKQSDQDLQELQKATGDDFVKKSKKLPDKVATEGKVPKKDEKKAGGGSDATVLE